MTTPQLTVQIFYGGWENYQTLLIKAIEPLSVDQLALRSAPHLHSIGEIVLHIIRARASWYTEVLYEGGEAMASLLNWSQPTMPTRSAAELINALQATWQLMQEAIVRWTPDEWEQVLGGTPEEPETFTRSWVIWHLIEHDVHHGGEVSLTLGMHGLEAPAL
jgi:uncharacterized damage-inducible protein DinB